jgi:hypothetical protein
MRKRSSSVRERRSQYFGQLFDVLGISFKRKGPVEIDNTVPLRVGDVSLQLYFNEANSRWGAYFAAHEGLYRGYGWTSYWLVAPVGKLESGYLKMVPIPVTCLAI